jgi:hypothetical protein
LETGFLGEKFANFTPPETIKARPFQRIKNILAHKK